MTAIALRTKGISPTGCPKCAKGRISKISQEWLDSLCVSKREVKFPGFRFHVDGFDPTTNTIYEFLGDYWHGNPKVKRFYSGINEISKKSFQELYNQTFQRFEKLKNAGYNLVYIWEKDFKEGKLFSE